MAKQVDEFDSTYKKCKVPRRKFLSTLAISSIPVALSTSAQAATPPTEDDLLPTPADSLSLYTDFLGKIGRNILRRYYVINGVLAKELRTGYEKLRADVDELIRLVPNLQTSGEVCRIKDAADMGRMSAVGIRSMTDGGILLTNVHLAQIALTSNSLNHAVNNWGIQQGYISLPPEAVKKLREVLCDIENLNKPTKALKDASDALTKADNALLEKTKEIRAIISNAIGYLVSAELDSSNPEMDRTKAIQSVKTAIDKLKEIDDYKPPKELQDYVNSLPPPSQNNTNTQSSDVNEPTKEMRDLLASTLIWIERGGTITARSDESFNRNSVRFLPASMNVPITVQFRLWRAVRKVLYDWLPKATRWRTGSCLGLIFPILIGGYDDATRINKIVDVLLNIVPSGDLDYDETRRKEAAKILAMLQV